MYNVVRYLYLYLTRLWRVTVKYLKISVKRFKTALVWSASTTDYPTMGVSSYFLVERLYLTEELSHRHHAGSFLTYL
jgi:hypothetical protein